MYITPTELIDRYPDVSEASDRDGDGTPDISIIQYMVDLASGEADSYLRTRYSLPIVGNIPNDLKQFVGDIARYRIYGNQATERIDNDYKRAVQWLKEIATGNASLDLGSITAEQDTKFAIATPPRIYTTAFFEENWT
jgi:phage gp36-like protein